MVFYIEKICEFYSKISKTKFTILRHSNVFGPYDTFDLNKSHVCAATIKKVIDSNTNKVKVWGNGREGRDLLFVYDLVEAIRLSIKTTYIEGPLKDLKTQWLFEKLESKKTKIIFNVSFEFQKFFHQKLAEIFFGLIEKKMVDSFKKRADKILD